MSHVRLEQPLRSRPRSFADHDALYAGVFENAPHAMALVSRDGSILNANRLFAQMLGFTKKELRSLNVAALTHPDDTATELEQRHRLASCEIGRYELVQRFVRKDQTIMWLRLSVSATRSVAGDLENFVVQVESVQPHLTLDGDSRDATAGDFKDATLSAMHEIANSLTPLMLNTEMLVEQTSTSPVRESAHEIFKAARRIAFAMRRVWGIEEVQPVAYVGENRMLDLRLVPPRADRDGPHGDEPLVA